ncbi:MAG: helix-turn-helix domain-containing protein [Bacteroidota bacterium]|nr:helix-turn-helix domain-containing protein [Bacteroidota bacterium]
MPVKTEQVPTLSGSEMDRFHFDTTLLKYFLKGNTELFHFNRIEEAKSLIKFPLPPHRKTVFDFVFLTQGTSIRSKGLDRYEFGKSTFFFLPAYQISSHEFYSEDATGFYCHFDIEILTKDLLQSGFLSRFSFLEFIGNPLVTVDEATVETLLPLLHRLEKEHLSGKPDYTLVSAYLVTLFLELQPFSVTTEKVKENAAFRITQQYKNALAQHVYERQSVSAYADLLAVTADYLNKCVKSITGKPAQELLSDMLVMEAKALLRQTSLSISEIAFKIGKEDPSDFTRFFRSKTGVTPTQYRQQS